MITNALYLFDGKVTLLEYLSLPVHMALDLIDKFVQVEKRLRKEYEREVNKRIVVE